QHCHERLADLPLRHLGLTGHTVHEANGHFTHREALHDTAVDHLDLEGVTLRHDSIQADCLQHCSRIAAIPGCGVPDPEAEQGPRVQVCAPREQSSVPAPAGHRALVHVTRPDHHSFATLGCGHELRQVFRPMRTVCVHLDDVVVAALQP